MKIKLLIANLLIIPLLAVSITFGDDLDDGISKYTDDGINKWDELGKSDKNIDFLKLNAKSKAMVRARSGVKNGDNSSGTGTNMNSVVMGAGSNVYGDIIIIDESKGDKFQISE